jgi:hypothetical protein
MWISGPITTVHTEHIYHELTAVARVGLATSRWLSDRSRSDAVVLGNHPISVRWSKTAAITIAFWDISHLFLCKARDDLGEE